MADTFPSAPGPDASWAPVVGLVAISYGSDQVFTKRVRGLHISTAGTLNVVMADGSTGSLVLAVGVYPYEVRQILTSGSSGVVGFALI